MGTHEPLLSVAPESPVDDEQNIAKAYRHKALLYYAWLPLALAFFLDVKFVLAAGFLIAIVGLNDVGARLYDLCIRLRRANVLLTELNKRSS